MAKTKVNPDLPSWSWTTRLVVGITLVAIAAFLAVRFQSLIAPLLLAFIVAYLFYPLARVLTCKDQDPLAPVCHPRLPVIRSDIPGFVDLGWFCAGRPTPESL